MRGALDVIDSLGFGYTNRLAPVALMLRTGEAVDAIENFVSSGRNATPTEAGGFVLCGLMQLGGLLYWAVIIPLLAIVLLCLPICTACGVFCYNTFCCCVRMRALEAGGRDEQTDEAQPAPVGLFPVGRPNAPFAHARLPDTSPPISPPSPDSASVKRAKDARLRSLLVQKHDVGAGAPEEARDPESASLLRHGQQDI